MRLTESSGAGGGTGPGSGHVLYKRAGAALGMGRVSGGTGRPWGCPEGLHNYKVSGSCIAGAVQEIGLIGSLHGRKLVPAGSRGSSQAAMVAGGPCPLPSAGQRLLLWPREHSPRCRSWLVALVCGRRWDGETQLLSCPDQLSAAVPKLPAVPQAALSQQVGMTL